MSTNPVQFQQYTWLTIFITEGLLFHAIFAQHKTDIKSAGFVPFIIRSELANGFTGYQCTSLCCLQFVLIVYKT